MKEKIAIIIMALSLTLAMQPSLGNTPPENNTITITHTIDTYTLQETQENNQTYHTLTIPGHGILPIDGNPLTPVKRILVILPENGEITNISITKDKTQELEGYTLYPSQPATWGNEKPHDFTINRTAYATDEYYPKNTLSITRPIICHGVTLAQIEIRTTQFNPVQEKILLHTSITLNIRYTHPPPTQKTITPIAKETCATMAINPDMIKEWYTCTTENRGTPSTRLYAADITDTGNTGDYVIITPGDLATTIYPLAEWKHQKGLETKIVNLTQIYTVFPGENNESIKKFIQYAYNNWSTAPSHILLIGDHDILPTNNGTETPPYPPGRCATDLPYTTLEGDDFLPDAMLGRLSVKNTSELGKIVNKILCYEKTPYTDRTDWYKNTTIFYGTSSPIWNDTANYIKDLLSCHGYNVKTWNEDQGNTTRMAREINNGLCFLGYREHGAVTGWLMANNGGFYNQDVYNLTNTGMLPVIYSTTCNTGWFDNTTTDCFAEAWMKKDPGGAIGFMGSSRWSLIGYNDELEKGCYKAIFLDNMTSMCGSMNRGKLYMYEHYGTGEHTYTHIQYQLYNCFSDPSLEIWTNYPGEITVTHPLSMEPGNNTITVTVTDTEINPLEGALVCLWKPDDIYITCLTDTSGMATLEANPSMLGDITVTVTLHNYIPYMGYIEAYAPHDMLLYEGWNMITIPRMNNWTAETLGNNITGCTAVSFFNTTIQGFSTHIVGTPYDDFPIQGGHGYFIYCSKDTLINWPDEPLESVNVSIYAGWNLIGWHKENSSTAESLGENITGCSIVTMFDGSSQTFLSHAVGTPHDNFPIAQGMGPFIYATSNSHWTGGG